MTNSNDKIWSRVKSSVRNFAVDFVMHFIKTAVTMVLFVTFVVGVLLPWLLRPCEQKINNYEAVAVAKDYLREFDAAEKMQSENKWTREAARQLSAIDARGVMLARIADLLPEDGTTYRGTLCAGVAIDAWIVSYKKELAITHLEDEVDVEIVVRPESNRRAPWGLKAEVSKCDASVYSFYVGEWKGSNLPALCK